jgi:hypothetical protein
MDNKSGINIIIILLGILVFFTGALVYQNTFPLPPICEIEFVTPAPPPPKYVPADKACPFYPHNPVCQPTY